MNTFLPFVLVWVRAKTKFYTFSLSVNEHKPIEKLSNEKISPFSEVSQYEQIHGEVPSYRKKAVANFSRGTISSNS